MTQRTQSQTPMPTYQPSGRDVNIFWDERVIERETDTGTETIYDYAYCVAPRSADYGTILVRLIRSQYGLNAELAAINDGGERHARFLTFREDMKDLAYGWLELRAAGVQPYPSWQLKNGEWAAPVPRPSKGMWAWDEDGQAWREIVVEPEDTRINVNEATQKQLESLPGVGAALAKRIIEGRPYDDVSDLARVQGISSAMADGWDITV